MSLFLTFFCINPGLSHNTDYEHLHCVIHVHTTVSGGECTFEKIAGLAKEKGIDVVIFTDHDIMYFEYGIPPFRKIFKKSIELPSVFKYGIEKYIKKINDVQREFPEIILILGVESAPFYYWKGRFFKKNLSINNWHKHILVVGLERVEDYKNLPSSLNPYTRKKYNPYKGDILEKPYQDFIDYVNSKGGLTFWAHPEANSYEKFNDISVVTPPHPEDLIETKDYTGFAALWEGNKEVTKPGSFWDKVLLDYCYGRRGKPVFAIGELDYKGKGNVYIDSIQNILTVKDKTKEECLNSLRNGNFYVMLSGKSGALFLDKFLVEKVKSNSVRINIKITSNVQKVITIKLINNGSLIKIFERETPVDLSYVHEKLDSTQFRLVLDSGTIPNKKSFYRIEAECQDGSKIISNPIFLLHE